MFIWCFSFQVSNFRCCILIVVCRLCFPMFRFQALNFSFSSSRFVFRFRCHVLYFMIGLQVLFSGLDSNFTFHVLYVKCSISMVMFQVCSFFKFYISGFIFHISYFRFHISYFMLHISDFRLHNPDVRFQISYFRCQVSDVRFQLS